jgi:hypothetical protein
MIRFQQVSAEVISIIIPSIYTMYLYHVYYQEGDAIIRRETLLTGGNNIRRKLSGGNEEVASADEVRMYIRIS